VWRGHRPSPAPQSSAARLPQRARGL
jgi:hypothetical protein